MKRPVSCFIMLVCGVVAGCERQPPAGSSNARARYTVGLAWQSDGYWFYPKDELSYKATGLAVVDADSGAAARITADGERYDPRGLAAAHQTLQLPVMLRVRNLENGRNILVRVNDRGPASPGRLLSVTPRAAQLLGMNPRGATRVELEEDDSLSQDLLQGVEGAPPPEATAAPIGSVQEQSLVPDGAPPSREAAAASVVRYMAQAKTLPRPIDESVATSAVAPGRLWIDAGHFSQPGYARRLAWQLRGTVRQDGRGRSAVFKVRVGPFDQVNEADAALDRARSAGVTGARIIVE